MILYLALLLEGEVRVVKRLEGECVMHYRMEVAPLELAANFCTRSGKRDLAGCITLSTVGSATTETTANICMRSRKNDLKGCVISIATSQNKNVSMIIICAYQVLSK
jgi:hypothetical protein